MMKMETRDKIKNGFIMILIGVVALLLWYKFMDPSRNNALVSEVAQYHNDTAETEKKRGIEFKQVHQALVETQQQLKSVIASNDTLRKLVREFSKVRSVTTYSTVVTLHDTIRFEKPIDKEIVGFPVESSEENYYFRGFIDQNHLAIDSLSIPNTTSIIEGDRKVGLFKTESQFMIVNSNPLVKTKGIQSLAVKQKKKWYENPFTWFGFGAATATGILILAK